MRFYVTPVNRVPGRTQDEPPKALIVPNCKSDGSGGKPQLMLSDWFEVPQRRDLTEANLDHGVVWEWQEKFVLPHEPRSAYFGVAVSMDSDPEWLEACPLMTAALAPFSTRISNHQVEMAPVFCPTSPSLNLRITNDYSPLADVFKT